MLQRFIYRVALRFMRAEDLALELASTIRMRMHWCERRVLSEYARRGIEVRA